MGKRWRLRLGTAAVLASMVLGVGASLPAKAAGDDCRVHGGDPDATVATLNSRSCTQGDLESLFAGLEAGPMPKSGSEASGYWRWDQSYVPDSLPAGLATEADRAMSGVWRGKVFYTDEHGGWIANRGDADARAFPARVSYGAAHDGRPAIMVRYNGCFRPDSQAAGLLLYDEVRRVQPDVYLGLGWGRIPGSGVERRYVFFTLNFHQPDVGGTAANVLPTDCPSSPSGGTPGLAQ